MTTGQRLLRRRAASVAVVAAVALLPGAASASAHDALRSSNPADGATVDRLPDRVVLTFDQPALALGSEVVVTGPAGPTSDGPPSLVDNEVRQPVRPGPAGRYTVVWRVTSADGHPVSGTFAFTTQQASTGPSSATSGSSEASGPSATSGSSAPTTAGTPASATAAAQPAAASGPGSTVVVVAIAALLALVALAWWARRRRSAPR